MVRPNLLRELSEQEVLDEIFRGGPITRPQIASATNLSKATVGAAIERLERAGIIRTAGQQHGRRGRSPVAYEIRGNAGFVLGIDIGGTQHPRGRRRHLRRSNPRRACADEPRRCARRVGAGDRDRRPHRRARPGHARTAAGGRAFRRPGVVDQVTRRVTSLAYNVSPDGGLDPLAALRARFDVPVRIENNVNLAALGEAWEGLPATFRRSRSCRSAPASGWAWWSAASWCAALTAGRARSDICRRPATHNERHRLHGGLEDEIGAAGILAALRERSGRDLESVHERLHARARRRRCRARRRATWSLAVSELRSRA